MWEVKVSKPDQSGVMRHHSTINPEQLIIERDEREGLANYANTRMFKKTFTSVCKFCKKEFQSMKKNQMYCSKNMMMRNESCAYLANKDLKKKSSIKRECICCKNIFETRVPQQIFCANPCKSTNLKLVRQYCVCGRSFRTHREKIKTCTKCRGTDKKYGRRD